MRIYTKSHFDNLKRMERSAERRWRVAIGIPSFVLLGVGFYVMTALNCWPAGAFCSSIAGIGIAIALY